MANNRYIAFAVVSLTLLGAGCASTASEKVETQYAFLNAPNIVYLRSFGTQQDVEPPSAFREWIIGKDIYKENKGMVKPWGVATTKGKVYVNDGRRLAGYWVFDLVKGELELIQNRSISGSTGIAVDDRDYKYLTVPRLRKAKALGTIGTDKEEGSIVVFNDKNIRVAEAIIPGRPIDIAVSGEQLFVTDGLNSRVLVIDKNSLDILSAFGKPGKGSRELSFPKGISAGNDGLIYVADTFNGRIKVFDRNGEFVSQYGHRSLVLGTFLNLSGLDVDRNGRVYAVDAGYSMKLDRDEIQVFDSSKFYFAGEQVPSLDTRLEDRKNALYGYFQRPNALMDPDNPDTSKVTLYAPLDIAIDYENVEFFADYAPPGKKFEYLIWLTSQHAFNGRNLSVFAYLADK